MVYIRSRKFCCCLPVRFGVFVMTFLGLVLGAFTAVVGWHEISQSRDHPIDNTDKIALCVSTVLYSILAVVSLFGFMGACIKRRGLVAIYSTMLAIHLGFSVGTGVFSLIRLFRTPTDEEVATCLDGSTDTSTQQLCGQGATTVKGITAAIFVVIWLIELYGCIIVSNYVAQLDDEQEMKEIRQNSAASAPVATYNAYTNTGPTTYAFSKPEQSFGLSNV